MQGNQADDFESLARRYWAAWGDMLRTAPTAANMSGMGAPQAAFGGPPSWQQGMDWWAQLAAGATPQATDAVGHFSRQAGQWYARMQEVAARFAGQQASVADVARGWQEALGAAGTPPLPDMLRSLRGHGLQGMDAWMEAATPWLQSMRGQGMSWPAMPAFGAGREHQERLQQLAAHMGEYQQASAAYAALMVRAQQEALPLFEARLAAHSEPGKQIDSGRALFDLWIDAAEEAYAAVALSPEFSEVYGRLVNAQMRVRGGVQRLVEDACAQMGMPTRSELDGSHRRLAQLEREVRKLRDALAGLQRPDGDGGVSQASEAGPHDAPAPGAAEAPAEEPPAPPSPKDAGKAGQAVDAGKPVKNTAAKHAGTKSKKGAR